MNRQIVNFLTGHFTEYLLTGILAAVFLLAGIAKIKAPQDFISDLANYRLLPAPWLPFISAGLPRIEVMAACALFIKATRPAASFLIAGMMLVFTLAVVSAMVRGLDITCGCFGKAFEQYAGSLGMALLRDAVLLGLALWLFYLNLRRDKAI